MNRGCLFPPALIQIWRTITTSVCVVPEGILNTLCMDKQWDLEVALDKPLVSGEMEAEVMRSRDCRAECEGYI